MKCCVNIDGNITERFAVLIDLRQGCLLSSTLFNIFVEFVVQEIESMSDEFLLTDEKLTMNVKYAHDTTLISSM